jgi:hypothetical protein
MMVKAAKEIPSTMTVVDVATGEETHRPMAWKTVPPPKDHCQICAVKHDPSDPHNSQSLYYQTVFQGIVGRPPTWADALAHCKEPVRQAWELELLRINRWTEPPAGEMPVRHHGIDS